MVHPQQTFPKRLAWLTLVGLWVYAGCDPARERPMAPALLLEPTTVTVVEPETGALAPANAKQSVVILATGRVTAVEVLINRSAVSDILGRQRQEFREPQEEVEVEFTVRIPDMLTGTHLEIRGVAEDSDGQQHISIPVTVLVIECDIFEIACSGS